MTNGYEADKSLNLFTENGERKYLSEPERQRFYAALSTVDEISRTFCEMIYWTGCRPSEALALSVRGINLESCHVVIRSLKKRGSQKGKHFRVVPLPRAFMERLVTVHGLSNHAHNSGDAKLWRFGRTTGWLRMAAVMKAGGITGARACARGLRHGFGVHAAMMKVPETRIQKWLGHASLATTAIYLDMAALEDREMARRMWPGGMPPEARPHPPPIIHPVTPFYTGDEEVGISEGELIRLVSAYAAIPDAGPRLAHLAGIEASAAR